MIQRPRPLTALPAGVVASAVVAVVGCGVSGTDLSENASEAQVAQGRILYERSCAACHGVTAEGTERGPPFLNDVYEPGHHADGAFLLAVRNGVPEHHWDFGDMPAVEGLSDEDVAGIVAYVRSLQRAQGID